MNDDPKQRLADAAFLSYCSVHSQTPRSGFTPKQLSLLYYLADPAKYADEVALYGGLPNQIVDCDSIDIRRLVSEARART